MTLGASCVRKDEYVVLRLASGTHKVFRIAADTVVSLGKHGSFPANFIIGRPFYLTYELLDKTKDEISTRLRIVPAAELHAEVLSEDAPTPSESRDVIIQSKDSGDDTFDVVADDGQVLIRNNRLTIDDPSRQALTSDEIEELKRAGTGSGRDIINRIMQSHAAIEEKTAFSLAKYTLRKAKKYLRRFTVLPMDVSMLAYWLLHEKEPLRIMELREETLGLIASWSNVHSNGEDDVTQPGGRYLVVDETGGLIIATMADRMGLLAKTEPQTVARLQENEHSKEQSIEGVAQQHKRDFSLLQPASSNTITVLHSANQPNLSLLEYFGYDSNNPDLDHQLYSHLHTLNLLQLLDPSSSALYSQEVEIIPEEELVKMKSSKRGAYHRKRRRWERMVKVVDETRVGGFDALIVASSMDLPDLLHPLVPLVRGGGQVVVYSPNSEPLAELYDCYSSARRTAFITALAEGNEKMTTVPNNDFPLDPRLLLGTSLQTSRATQWQVLPGRTHPLMTSRGSAEGFVFTGTRVIPSEEKVEARGNFSKKRAAAAVNGSNSSKRKVSDDEAAGEAPSQPRPKQPMNRQMHEEAQPSTAGE